MASPENPAAIRSTNVLRHIFKKDNLPILLPLIFLAGGACGFCNRVISIHRVDANPYVQPPLVQQLTPENAQSSATSLIFQ